MNRKMCLYLTIVIIFALSLCLSCDTTSPKTKSITIFNDTGHTIASAYVRNPNTTEWKPLFTADIPTGSSRSHIINWSAVDTRGMIDIQTKTANEVLYTKIQASIGEEIITFTVADIDPISLIVVDFKNDTGVGVRGTSVRLPGTLEWVELTNEDIRNGWSQTVFISPHSIDTNGKADVRIGSYRAYTKLNQTITAGETITFVASDLGEESGVNVTIRNNTSETITSGRVRPSNTTNTTIWYDIFNTSVASGTSIPVTISTDYINSDGLVDMWLTTSSTNVYKKSNLAIYPNAIIIFTDNDRDPLLININNITGETILYGDVRKPGNTEWESLFTGTVGNGDTGSVPISTAYLDGQGRADLRVITAYSGGLIFTKLNQLISFNTTISFTPSDFYPSDFIPITISNDTEYTISTCKVRKSDSTVWSSLFSNASLIHGATMLVHIDPSFIDEERIADIEVSNGIIYYTKLSHNFVANETITFGRDDLDPESYLPVIISNNTGFTLSDLTHGASKSIYINPTLLDNDGKVDLVESSNFGGNRYIYFIKRNHPITAYDIITFGPNDLDTDRRPLPVNITNNTGFALPYLFAREPGTIDWGTVTNDSGLIDGASQLVFIDSINNLGRADIRLSLSNTTSSVYYTKLNQTISPYYNITFTSDDIDTESRIPVYICNATGTSISNVFMRVPGTTYWLQSQHLVYNWISIGSTVAVPIPLSAIDSQNRTDIRLNRDSGAFYTKLNQEVEPNGIVFTFDSSDIDPTSPIPATIQNDTGVTISSGRVKLPGWTEWTYLFSTNILDGLSIASSVNQGFIDDQGQSDLQLRTSNGVFYTKLSHTITVNGVIAFSTSDLDPESAIPVTVQNNTGVSISFANVRYPGTIDWVPLPYVISISDGGSQMLAIPQSVINGQDRTDIQLRATIEGVYFTRISQVVTQNEIITFSEDNIDPTSPRPISILNRTGGNISQGFVRVSGTTSWVPLFATTVSNGGTYQTNISSVYLNNQGQCDLQLRTATSGGASFTKLQQPIGVNSIVIFTENDEE